MFLTDHTEQFRPDRPGLLLHQAQQLVHALMIDAGPGPKESMERCVRCPEFMQNLFLLLGRAHAPELGNEISHGGLLSAALLILLSPLCAGRCRTAFCYCRAPRTFCAAPGGVLSSHKNGRALRCRVMVRSGGGQTSNQAPRRLWAIARGCRLSTGGDSPTPRASSAQALGFGHAGNTRSA